jgi:NADPH:quinone reductase-like Zn-dependent oxidoreductase
MTPARIPEKMRALVFHEHGGPDVHRVEEIPTPEAGPGDVLVAVDACAANRLDVFVREGWPGLDLVKPHVSGCDIAGTVAAVGDGVDASWVGTRVVVYPDLSCGECEFCLNGENVLCRKHRIIGEHVAGGFAEFVRVPAGNVKEIPDDFPSEDAAATCLVYLTAWRMMITRGQLKAGETVLVVGSGGGVNTAAIQIARLAGASRVFVAGGSKEKLDQALELGATDVINYNEEPFEKAVFKATGKRGVDLVVDNVGEATWTKSLRAVRHGGRILTVGGTTGYNPGAAINLIFWKQVSVIGSTMGTRREFDTVMDLVFQGRLKAVVDRVIPLSKAKDGIAALEHGDVAGKVVITPRE